MVKKKSTKQPKTKAQQRLFYKRFGAAPARSEGKLVYDVGEWDIPGLRKVLEEILPQNSRFEGFEVEHEFPNIGRRKLLVNARRLIRGQGQAGMILMAIEDAGD